MRLKGTVRILMEDNTVEEVVGDTFEYTYNDKPLNIILHESVQPWTPNVLDISEATTGCRLTSTDKPVSSSTKADIISALNQFIVDKGFKNLLDKIKERTKKRRDLTKE